MTSKVELSCTTSCGHNIAHSGCELTHVRIWSGVCRECYSINSKQDEKIYAYMKEKIRLRMERIKRHRANTKNDKTMGDRRKEDIVFVYDSNLLILEEVEHLLDLIAGK